MKLINKTYLIILATALVFGCSVDTSKVEHRQAKTENKIIVAPIGKSSAPISMSYVISKDNLESGDEFTIDLSFQTQLNSAISIKANAFESLTLLNTEKSWQTNLTKSGNREILPKLNFIATINGTFYVKLMASVVQDGKALFKPFVIPVVIGDGAVQLKSVGEVKVDSKGQRVIVQKASPIN